MKQGLNFFLVSFRKLVHVLDIQFAREISYIYGMNGFDLQKCEIHFGDRRQKNIEVRFVKTVRRIRDPVCNRVYGSLSLLLPANDNGQQAVYQNVRQCGGNT